MGKHMILSAALAVLSLAGCSFARTSGVMVEKGRIYIEDPAFAANIEVVQDMREVMPDGFLHAQVTLKNANRTDYECQYRFEWRDKSGMMQKHAPAPWRPLFLHGRTTETVDAVCPLANADDFRLFIRR